MKPFSWPRILALLGHLALAANASDASDSLSMPTSPTVHPGPETEGPREDNVSPGFWQAVAEFLGEVLSGSAPSAQDSGPSGRPRGF